MSYVMLVAADHPLPLYDSGIRRSSASTAGGACVQVETPGFSIQPHQYYRDAVEALGLEMKLWQYELNVEAAEAEAEQLRAYLKRSCRPGETIELWNLWVGDDREEKIARFQGRLGDLDREALEQLCDPPTKTAAPASAGWRSPFDFHLRAVLPGKEDQLWQAIASDASTRRSSGSCPL